MKKLCMLAWMLTTPVCFGQFYIEAGPWARGDMDLEVAGGSRAALEGVQAASPGLRGGVARVEPLAVPDDGTAQILREFDDGYVGPSGWQWAAELGYSQYFGYESAGQYDATASTLTFTTGGAGSSTASRTRTSVSSGSSGWAGGSGLDGAGGLVTLGYTFTVQRLFDVSLQVQAGWLDGLDASFQGQTAWSQEVRWTRYESHAERSQAWSYVYDTLGNPFFPTAPYEMTDPAGFGPLISDRPIEIQEGAEHLVETERVAGRKRKTAVSRVDLETEGSLLVLTFGPRLRFRPMERLAILVQGGATANLLDVELSRTETFAWDDGRVIRAWTDRADEQEWLWGATISAGVQFDVTQNLYLTAAGGYDWVERVDFAIGPDRVRYDLDGWRAEVALGWRFGGR
jgi:opacity protein-like surface antigen